MANVVKADYIGRFKKLDALLPLVGGLLILVGSFLAWATVNVLFINASIAGTEGDGKYSAIAGGLILVLVILSKTIWNAKEQLAKKLNYVLLALAIIAFGIIAYDGTQLLSVKDDFGMIKLGIGVYLVAAGSVLTFIACVKNIFKVKKQFGMVAIGVIVAVAVAVSVFGYLNKENFNGSNSLSNDFSSANTTDWSDWSSGLQNKSSSTSSSSSNEAAPTLTVVSKTIQQSLSYYDDTRYVVGEIKNTSSTDAYIQEVTASLYSDGKVVASGTSGYTPVMIKKGQTAPYKAMITNVPAYDEIKVTVSAKTSAQAYQKCTNFDVLSSTPRDGGYGSLLVAGEVKNSTTRDYSYGVIHSWLLDSNDKVIDVTSTYINAIKAGANSAFEASFYFDETIPTYNDLKVIAESCY